METTKPSLRAVLDIASNLVAQGQHLAGAVDGFLNEVLDEFSNKNEDKCTDAEAGLSQFGANQAAAKRTAGFASASEANPAQEAKWAAERAEQEARYRRQTALDLAVRSLPPRAFMEHQFVLDRAKAFDAFLAGN